MKREGTLTEMLATAEARVKEMEQELFVLRRQIPSMIQYRDIKTGETKILHARAAVIEIEQLKKRLEEMIGIATDNGIRANRLEEEVQMLRSRHYD